MSASARELRVLGVKGRRASADAGLPLSAVPSREPTPMSVHTPEAPREHEAPQQERQDDANAKTNTRVKWAALLLLGVSALVAASFFVGMSVGATAVKLRR